ncbi:hypothetical protein COV24_02395 [candidate division WWE3 bacterium CG10_big_fil_rev_8_21_14_0_10_32_10]|uniref:DUF192 domain-containing protein n=1 Tax=candidate division WWE3 bacterium CG10_big_fil_rev_8_21_14_0_10_32_10 TaxID=1975090 RepID=A0A2H0RAG1_UNCKA|nr:MAG: hypothetical protein COV24_02395 [candidate division WWE3 bacterium CG10_big_fil_rev_8_21_14_0_10_32_10]
MKKRVCIIFLIIICALYFFLKITKHNTVTINKHNINIEIANTPELREKGLMNRKSLCKNCGMLFIFDKENIYPFWMKNTYISLDLAWIDSNNKIVEITTLNSYSPENEIPAYTPNNKALYVLEVNNGFLKKNNMKVGDTVIIRYTE